MKNQIISTAYNPVSGVFGTGQVIVYGGSTTTQTFTWTVPAGIGAVRARCWGGGGGSGASGGGGGGFAMKAIYDLTGVTSIAVTVGLGVASGNITGGTSSFGSYVSATGGQYASTGGSGSGGDINYTGGTGGGGRGGGSASIFGNGGDGNSLYQAPGGAGGGSNTGNQAAGNGFLGMGGWTATATSPYNSTPPTSGLSQFSIDFIGTGGGGGYYSSGINGGGGSAQASLGSCGGYPGGGAGHTGYGGWGMVIVEW
jgi:hypothetical protein